MKNLFKIIIVFAIALNCYAQSPIINISDKDGTRITGAYYKDVNNQLDQYVGTYLYTNGTTSLKLVLKKMVQSNHNNLWYEDLIVGEYEYIVNGVIKRSSLIRFIRNGRIGTNKWEHTIKGNNIFNHTVSQCLGCVAGDKVLVMYIKEDDTKNSGYFNVRKIMVGSQETININITWPPSVIKQTDPPLVQPKLPAFYNLILIKQ